jgi:predicted outer membrane repeat protein
MNNIAPRLMALCFCLFTLHAAATTYYVDINSPNPTPPYTTWATASTDIQNAINAASPADLVLVTDGVYQVGGETMNGYGLTNRVAIDKAVTVQSINGPTATIIAGYQDANSIVGLDAIRCVYMTNGAVLSGFTLTNGATLANGDENYEQSGGGIFCESTNAVITNCLIEANLANNGGGGIVSGTLLNCTLRNDTAYNDGGGANASVASNSTFSNCSAGEGGGAFGSTINECLLSGNSSGDGGGGANSCLAVDCLFIGNSAFESGGGVYASTAQNSVFTNNYSNAGGGAGFSTVNNSELSGNSANWGGAAAGGTLNNCTMVANSASGYGGGGADCTMNNCIVYYNTSPDGNNFKFDGEIYGTMNYCDTTPSPDTGSNNITAEPQLADFAHLGSGSPCIGAGSVAYASGTDLDGQPWLNPPSIGCDEFYPGASGPLTVSAHASFLNVATGFTVNFSGAVFGYAGYNVWNFGDATFVTNLLYVSHGWTAAGNYPVTFTAYNISNPGGISATVMVQVLVNPVSYVSLDSANPVAPFLSWNTAATNIQDAIDAGFAGGAVLVSNGVYHVGGETVNGYGLTNRVAIGRPITVESLNGPAVTVIAGFQDTNDVVDFDSIRCVYLADGAVLSGFTLTNGATLDNGDGNYEQSGGGIFCESTNAIVTNCVIIGNAASNSGGGGNQGTFNGCVFIGNAAGTSGGGANNCFLNNCVLTNNIAGTVFPPMFQQAIRLKGGGNPMPFIIVSTFGGGAEASTLNNCILTANSAQVGGGLDSSTAANCLILDNNAEFGGGVNGGNLNNCAIVANTGWNWGGGAYFATLNNCIDFYNTNYDGYSTYNYCCTDQDPAGAGNITNDPAFVNWQNSDFHLTANSPCINSGDNLYVTATNDLDGNPRIVGSTVDIGAYEYQTPTSVLSYAWAQEYGLPTDGSVDYKDLDGTGMNNWQKWIAGLDPTNPASILAMLPPTATNNSTGITITWQSVDNRNYCLLRATNLATEADFWLIASNILGQAGTTSYTDPCATNNGPYFYRVAVSAP